MENKELKEAREKNKIGKEEIHKKIEATIASERKHEAERFHKEPQEDKVKRNASLFLDAWFEAKSPGINKNSYSGNVDFHVKKTFFKNVQLHGYEILSYKEIDRDKASIHVNVTLNNRGETRKKIILIYAVKIKNEWKVDLKSLLPS